MATIVQPTAVNSTWGVSPAVRRTVARLVLDARRDLEDDFRRQLASFDVYPDRVDDLPADRKLTTDEERAREAAIAVIDRVVAAEGSRGEAFETFVRDSAFTFLNRMVGLRCLEERGMLWVDSQRETAIRVDERLRASSLYFRVRNELPADTSPREVWRETLDKAFRAVSERVGTLFDPESEYGRLLPLQSTLVGIVKGLNDPSIPSSSWGDDEILGWVYQYYSSEEKDRVYDKLRRGGKLERPEEIAAASCLYTERYMVDFLLQNTLGALWAQMHPATRLPASWAYYIRSTAQKQVNGDTAPKRVRDVTLLDPAVGSGHFHARAFDLLVEIYEEEGLEDRAEIPQLILDRNLHGIDIDLRAVQITALRLYLKACEIAGPEFRPRSVNLVSADIVLPAAPPAPFLERFSGDREVQDLIEGIWSQLKQAPTLGSLLHPERLVDELLARRRQKGDTLLRQDDRAWERFKIELLDGIREEFERQAQSEEIGRRLFGQDAAKGVSLAEALIRRYDVVVTNPPYAGSKNLDDDLKQFVGREYKDGKRDLYSSFILRATEFARESGFVGMVAQQTWMFLRSFAKLRERVLAASTVTALAHLGPRGFEEIGGEVVNVALFALRTHPPPVDHMLTALRLIGPKSPAEKDRLLRRAVAGEVGGVVFTPAQADLEAIPETPFVYWLSPRFFQLLKSGKRLSSVADVRQGLATADNNRFLRCFWEVPEFGVITDEKPMSGRWFRFAKGGRYQKWAGLESFAVNWADQGREIKSFVGSNGRIASRAQNTQYYFRPGITYTFISAGNLGLRLLDNSSFDVASMSIFTRAWPRQSLMALLNSRVSTYLLRVTTQSYEFHGGYVANLPLPTKQVDKLGPAGHACGQLKGDLVSSDPTEWAFDPSGFLTSTDSCSTSASSLLATLTANLKRAEAAAALLHSIEGWTDHVTCEAYELNEGDVRAVIEETRTPAGWHPPIAAWDELTPALARIELPEGFDHYFEGLERRELSSSELSSLRGRLRTLYEAGPGVIAEEDEPSSAGDKTVLGAHIPIPPETFLEELSVKLGFHPVSVYRLLEDIRENEGLVCPPEMKRAVEDYVSVTVLLLLGYRWPDQDAHEAERGPAVDPDLVDPDGIVPLVPCDDRAGASERIRSVLEGQFGEEGAARAIEEFRIWSGRELGDWLRRAFFRWHIQQFKQRPIAWHLTSPEGTFQCLVLYHRLSRDMLRRLRDVYAGALLNRLKAELREAQNQGDAAVSAEIRLQIEDVEDFRDRLLAIEQGRELANRIRCRWKGEEEEEDGRRGPYAPDIDDGVKVNIRPFQETGLLARDVINKW